MGVKKIFITEPGDRSVGIGDWKVTIDLEFSDDDDGIDFITKEDREKARDALRQGLLWFMDGPLYILFDDECPDCLMVMEDGKKCENKSCVSYNEGGTL